VQGLSLQHGEPRGAATVHQAVQAAAAYGQGKAAAVIHVTFRLICTSSKDGDRLLGVYFLPVVPAPGESINLDGHPYVVHERGWAYGDGVLHCYVRLVNHHGEPPDSDGDCPDCQEHSVDPNRAPECSKHG
jgi:hypothetical protein